MPFEIKNQGDFLFARFYGVVTAEDLDRFGGEVEAVEDALPAALDRVADISATEHFEVGFAAMNRLAERRRVRRFSRPIRSAIVVRGLMQLGMARMFQTLNDNPQIEIRIFHTVAEAKFWAVDRADGKPA